MIRATVDVRDSFGRVSDEIRRKTIQGLQAAADEGKAVAEHQARTKAGHQVSTFFTIHPHGDADGFASGIKKKNPLVNIFDKGSLGLRIAPLKEAGRRKADWPVHRKGANPYVAHRGDTSGEGIEPLNILNTARAAGRRALLAALRH